MKFEVGKFYRTRDGRKAQIFMLDNGDTFMIGAIQHSDQTWIAQTWPKSGIFNAKLSQDLISEWREPIERKTTAWVSWVNSFDDGSHLNRLGIYSISPIKNSVSTQKVEIIVREVQE